MTASLCVAARACWDERRHAKISAPLRGVEQRAGQFKPLYFEKTHLECCGHASTGLPQRANRHHAGSEPEQIVGAIGPESIGRAPDCILRKADEALRCRCCICRRHCWPREGVVLAVSRLIEAPMRPDGAGMIQLASLLWGSGARPVFLRLNSAASPFSRGGGVSIACRSLR